MPVNKCSQEGFSLLELAIVLVVVGLIAGGVLKGKDLIDSARLNSIQTQANELRQATQAFYKKYDGFPGDISATDAGRLPVSVSGIAAGTSGIGDGMVQGNRLNGSTAAESTWFWQHLRASGMLSGVQTVSNGTLSATQALQSKMNGVWTFDWADSSDGTLLSSNGNLGVPDADHWFLLGASSSATANFTPVMTPTQLRGIDMKADDGMPNTGNIAGGNSSATTCKAGSSATSGYAVSSAITCVAWFRL